MTTATTPIESNSLDYERIWGLRCLAAVCERCDAAYLLPEENAAALLERCPRCFSAALTPLPLDGENPRFAFNPELAAPFELTDAGMIAAIQQFTSNIPYPPLDLTADNLRRRARRMYLPIWLLDVQAHALWSAEAGFDYEVVSHRDQYAGGGWSSQQVQEARIRWEARVGRLERAYTNIAAPALEDNDQLRAQLGDFNITAAQPYGPDTIRAAILRVPDRSPQDAWSDAHPAVQAAAADECRQAAGADHIRRFTWQPEFKAENWTLLLSPVISTVYFDDEQTPQPVWINAQTGQINGKRRASPKRAARAAGIWLAVAAIIFLMSGALSAAAILLPFLAVLGLIGFVVAVLVGVGAAVPLFRVWTFNRRELH